MTRLPLLDVHQLTFGYREDRAVLRGADLRLVAGSVVGLLGPNGSGKSTMLGAITNSIAGERGGSITMADGCRSPIGYATQEVALYTHLTVTENLEHAARVATGRWDVADLVTAAIDDFGLAAFAGRLARELSGGQQRIAHLAASFVHRPHVRLLDEPTTALDFATREVLVELVARWRDEGIATLVTAHYPEDVEELCTDLVLMVDGETHLLGPLHDHLARQSRLGTLVRTLDALDHGDTVATTVELDGPMSTLAELTATAAHAGVGPDDPLHALAIRPPSLRDLLRRDPTLREAVGAEVAS